MNYSDNTTHNTAVMHPHCCTLTLRVYVCTNRQLIIAVGHATLFTESHRHAVPHCRILFMCRNPGHGQSLPRPDVHYGHDDNNRREADSAHLGICAGRGGEGSKMKGITETPADQGITETPADQVFGWVQHANMTIAPRRSSCTSSLLRD